MPEWDKAKAKSSAGKGPRLDDAWLLGAEHPLKGSAKSHLVRADRYWPSGVSFPLNQVVVNSEREKRKRARANRASAETDSGSDVDHGIPGGGVLDGHVGIIWRMLRSRGLGYGQHVSHFTPELRSSLHTVLPSTTCPCQASVETVMEV